MVWNNKLGPISLIGPKPIGAQGEMSFKLYRERDDLDSPETGTELSPVRYGDMKVIMLLSG